MREVTQPYEVGASANLKLVQSELGTQEGKSVGN